MATDLDDILIVKTTDELAAVDSADAAAGGGDYLVNKFSSPSGTIDIGFSGAAGSKLINLDLNVTDLDQGTFNPGITSFLGSGGSGVVSGSTHGDWVRVGELVSVAVFMEMTGAGTLIPTDHLAVDNLPFDVATSANSHGGGPFTGWDDVLNTDIVNMILRARFSSDLLVLFYRDQTTLAASGQSLLLSDVDPAGFNMSFIATYPTDD